MSAAAGTVATALAQVRGMLQPVHGEQARLEAELLLCRALGCSRAWLVAHAGDPLASLAREEALALAGRRREGVPVAQLLGRREFWSMDLTVTSQVLIPRPETELLVERALARLPPGAAATVADLGTGSGAVALAIARERPAATVIASDASIAALRVAAGNVARLAPGRVLLLAACWLEPLVGAAFDLLVSNPPYVASADPHLRQGDLRFEPRAALDGGADGLDPIRALAASAPGHLRPGGWLLLEHGADQGAAVRALLCQAGFHDVATRRDLAGLERVSEGRTAA